MQEEITQKTLALCVETGKMTAQLLQQAMKKVLADMEKHKNDPQLHHGKQTIRQLKADGYIPVCAEPYGRCAMKSVASPQDGTTAKQTSEEHLAAKQAWQLAGDDARAGSKILAH